MLDGGIIQRLLEEKWKTFARNQFLKRLLILFIHLFFLSMSIYLRPATENTQVKESDHASSKAENTSDEVDGIDVKTILRYCCEIATIAGVLSYVIFQQGDEVKNQGFSAFLKQLPHAPAKAIFLVSNLLILACIPFRIIGDIDTEEAILVFAVPGSWFLLMFFAGAVRLTGPFVTMIYSMLTGDMFTFGIIYTIVLFGFSQAFYFLFKGHAQVQSTLFNTYPSTWMALFQTTLGDYNYPDLNNTSYPNLAKTVFVIFMIFVPILLLNMLIAMMGNTYAHVIEQSEKEWMKQWAKIVVTLERAVPQTDAQKYLEAYSIPLGPSDDSGFEQRGVMVIKSKSKTRAKQRKGAVSNWKYVGRVTLSALKKRGMTGEELRRIMWGRASITSPTKVSKKKPKDPYNIFAESNSVLGAAVDVMSFTHDIVLCTETPEPPADIEPTKPKKDKSSINPVSHTPTTGLLQSHDILQHSIKDPLRELVLISETAVPTDTNYLTSVTHLANQASVLVQAVPTALATSVPPSLPPSSSSVLQPQKGAEITNLQSLFQDPKDIADPEKEKAFLKQLEALDDTEDSDGFIERPVLGKISLIRRAKSAVSRTSSGKKINERHPLFSFAWDEEKNITGEGNGVDNEAYENTDEIIQIEENVKEDVVEDEDVEIVTVEDVKRKMEQLHLKHRPPTESERRQGKSARTRRHKNKVSPENTITDEKIKNRRGKSAQEHRSSKRYERRDDSPPDPLEPWSTRELANINKILES